MKEFFIRLFLFPFRRIVLIKRFLCIKVYGYKVTSDFQKICEQSSILCWLDYGTLLGIIRKKSFLTWDTDIDVGLFVENQDEFKKFLNSLINSHKMTCICVAKSIETNSIVKIKLVRLGVLIDISVYYRSRNNLSNKFTYLETEDGWKVKQSKIFNFKQIFVKGHRFNIPFNEDEYLSNHYGKDFLIPNSKWKQKDSRDIDFKIQKVEIINKRFYSVE